MTDQLVDFRNFMAAAWRANGLQPPTRLQYFLANLMQYGPNELVVLCFRGFGKSIIGTTRGNHCLYLDQERRFMNVSAAKNKADESSTYMLNLFSAMPETRHLAPGREGRASVAQFDVQGATQAHAPSVRSLGIMSNSVTGSRASDILADDIESKENSATLSMRARVREKNRELGAYVLRSEDDFPLDAPPKICHLGTPQVEESMYWELEHAGHTVVIIPARYPDAETQELYGDRLASILREDLEKDPSLVGQPTEPDRFSDKVLKKRERKAGPHGWALQFMLLPTLAEANRYPLKLPDLIVTDCDVEQAPEKQFWSGNHIVDDLPCPGLTGQQWHGPNPSFEGKMMPYTGNVMAVDPSTGGTDELAYAVVKVINSQVFVLDCGGFQKGDAEDTMFKLADITKQFGVTNVRVEKNFGMGMWSQLFRPILRARNGSCVIEDVHVVGRKNIRICATLEPIIASRRMVVSKQAIENDIAMSRCYGGEKEAELHQLFYQMAHITRDPDCLVADDRIDALALAVSYFEESLDRDFKLEMQERELDEMDDMLEDWNNRSLFIGRDPEPEMNWIN
jgi:hypothetical protein